jgi:DDE family transposase
MADVRIGLDEITGYFDELEDPRSTINQRHPFVSVLVIAIMGVFARANGPTAIAKWAKIKSTFHRLALAPPFSGFDLPTEQFFARL